MARQFAALVAFFSFLALGNLAAEQDKKPSDKPQKKQDSAEKAKDAENRKILAPSSPPKRPDAGKRPSQDSKADRDADKMDAMPSKAANKQQPGIEIPDQLQNMLQKMEPEQRQRFWQNLQKWQNMDAEEKDYLRNRVQGMQEEIRKEASQALAKSGLKLDGDRKEVFELRFFQERRKLERDLREKMERDRQDGMRAIIVRLRKEFEPYAEKKPEPERKNQNADKNRNQKPDNQKDDGNKGQQGNKNQNKKG